MIGASKHNIGVGVSGTKTPEICACNAKHSHLYRGTCIVRIKNTTITRNPEIITIKSYIMYICMDVIVLITMAPFRGAGEGVSPIRADPMVYPSHV